MVRGRSERRAGNRDRLLREEGTIYKDRGGRLPVALIYPNSYYLGMSNLGIHAIYRLLNSYPDVVCERVFFEGEGTSLSVESRRPLRDFAIIAFSVSYELDYFNIPRILKAGGIPLFARERGPSHPLLIAGGPCITANPLPVSPFFDCLGIGEAEVILPAMLPVLQEGLIGSREDLREKLASLPGIYCPLAGKQNKVCRQWLQGLDDFPTASTVFTPDTELGDLFLMEVERGCGRGCRFCLVHSTYSPMRFRSVEFLLRQAEQGLKYRKRVGLVGPAVTDHPRIEELMRGLLEMGAGISVSSARIGPRARIIMELLASGGSRTVTLAPEAGSPRLRKAINKNLSQEEIIATVARAAGLGMRQIKLYFMLGLPSETEEDIQATIRLALALKETVDAKGKGTRLTLNFSPFIPKAGTPFQRYPVAPVSVLNERLTLLKKSLTPKGIRIRHESPAWSQVQGVLSRGDSKIADVLADTEEITLSGWRRSAEKYHIDLDYYSREWEAGEKLPWDFIDLGARGE